MELSRLELASRRLSLLLLLYEDEGAKDQNQARGQQRKQGRTKRISAATKSRSEQEVIIQSLPSSGCAVIEHNSLEPNKRRHFSSQHGTNFGACRLDAPMTSVGFSHIDVYVTQQRRHQNKRRSPEISLIFKAYIGNNIPTIGSKTR